MPAHDGFPHGAPSPLTVPLLTSVCSCVPIWAMTFPPLPVVKHSGALVRKGNFHSSFSNDFSPYIWIHVAILPHLII